MKCTCKQCGKEFEISNSEIEFYKSKNLSIPKRCKECRNKNRRKSGPYNKKAKRNVNNVKPEEKTVPDKIEEVKKVIDDVDEIAKTVTENAAPKKKGLKAVISIIVVAVLAVAGLFLGPLGGNNQDEAYDDAASDPAASVQVDQSSESDAGAITEYTEYEFRNEGLKESHFQKHGVEMGFASADEYEDAAEAVINNVNALHKTEAEDGDDIYYIEDSNELVVVSTDGYIRTYFEPSGGMSYYEKQ